ncbi:putative serine/threonine-protein phosphatase [Aspergillus lucknowensis]|uniref:Metallo-dependent phosphatase-like protein n=1 Tax=Aspergillus lucknowensis TaxID=176173 RepID=A0ABR4LVC4_9EURO
MADRDHDGRDSSSDTFDDGLHHHSTSSPPSRLTRFARPLIDYVRNVEWQPGAKYTHLPSTSDRSESPKKWVQMGVSIVTAPRFRRYVVVYLGLVVSCWLGWHYYLHPHLVESSILLQSLDPKQKGRVGGWFGANAVPQLEDVIQLKELDKALLPATLTPEEGEENRRRLVVVGDVHGCRTECTVSPSHSVERLLDKVSFNVDNDHLIFTGDLIEKGPDSLGVVDLAREYNASCVRGNHEDKVLVLRDELLASSLSEDDLNQYRPLDAESRKLARELSDDQAKWLAECPVILNVGPVANMGQVVVVHGGLVPGVDLERQDPYSVMNMHSIDLKTHVPSSSRDWGTKWTKLFNKHQSITLASKTGVMTAIYGHDAKSGLSIKEYTKGLDSGCVKGGKLTALVISDGGNQQTVQVGCSNYMEE